MNIPLNSVNVFMLLVSAYVFCVFIYFLTPKVDKFIHDLYIKLGIIKE